MPLTKVHKRETSRHLLWLLKGIFYLLSGSHWCFEQLKLLESNFLVYSKYVYVETVPYVVIHIYNRNVHRTNLLIFLKHFKCFLKTLKKNLIKLKLQQSKQSYCLKEKKSQHSCAKSNHRQTKKENSKFPSESLDWIISRLACLLFYLNWWS